MVGGHEDSPGKFPFDDRRRRLYGQRGELERAVPAWVCTEMLKIGRGPSRQLQASPRLTGDTPQPSRALGKGVKRGAAVVIGLFGPMKRVYKAWHSLLPPT